MSIFTLFQQSSLRNTHRGSIVQGDTSETCQQLVQHISALSMALRQQLGAVFTLVLLEQTTALVKAALAIIHAGEVFIPISPSLTLLRQCFNTLFAQPSDTQFINTTLGQAHIYHLIGLQTIIIVDNTDLTEKSEHQPAVCGLDHNMPQVFVYFTSSSPSKPTTQQGRGDNLQYAIIVLRNHLVPPQPSEQLLDNYVVLDLLPFLTGGEFDRVDAIMEQHWHSNPRFLPLLIRIANKLYTFFALW